MDAGHGDGWPDRAALDVEPRPVHGQGTRSLRVAWLLAEMALPHRTTPVAFPPRLKQPEFPAANPAGSRSSFVDGPVGMTGSVAICLYPVETCGPTCLSVSPAQASSADDLRFRFDGDAAPTQPLGTILRYRHPEPPGRRSPQVEDARAPFQRPLDPVAPAIAYAGYAAADIPLGYALAFAARPGGTALPTPAIQADADRMVTSGDPRRDRTIGDDA